MDMEKWGVAKVVQNLALCSDNLREAMSGAQMAKDEPLFGRLYQKQTEIWDMLAELVKTKEERNAKG